MGGFHSKSREYHEHAYIFSTRPQRDANLQPGSVEAALGATRLHCFTPTQFKSGSESTVGALCQTRCPSATVARFCQGGLRGWFYGL